MKRLWTSVAILIVVFSVTLLNSQYLSRFTIRLTDLLTLAEQSAENGDWVKASALTKEAVDQWHAHDRYLYTVLRHSDTDEVHVSFREVLEFINCEEGGEYSAANAKLITKIELLYEMEQLSMQNLL